MNEAIVILGELELGSGLTRADIVELVEYGVFEPQGASPETWEFSESALLIARSLGRLRRDFDLHPAALALIFSYRERIEAQERELRRIRCLLPR